MNIITFVESPEELLEFSKAGVNEFIVSCSELSRFAKNSREVLLEIIKLNNSLKLNLTLEWDALYQEGRFELATKVFERLPLHEFKAVRLQDPGTVNLVKKVYPWLKVQLILETGNHNLIGLKRWSEFLGNQLERIILSNELSKEHLEKYGSELNVAIEVLVLGRILLFYSPRNLLNPVIHKKMDYIEAKGTSEESPHSGFPLIENSHGTYMFNVKDLSLLDHVQELEKLGINNLRIDLRFDNLKKELPDIIKKIKLTDYVYKLVGDRPFIKGFYNVNKSDILFAKLKNKRVQRDDVNYIGEVIDVEKDVGLCLSVKNNISNFNNASIKVITPEGKEKTAKLTSVKNSAQQILSELKNEDIVLIPYIRGVTVKSQVYFVSRT